MKIYGLVDPRTGKVRYVGYTSKSLKKRLEQHIGDKSRTHKVNWIESLQKVGLVPRIVILEKAEGKEWQEAERKWVKHFGRENLVNGTDGGDGIVNPSKELRQKRSEAKRGKKHHMFGKHHSEESRKKMSKKRSRYFSKVRRGKRHSEESRKKMSEAKRGVRHPMFGRRHSEESRKKMSEAAKRRSIRQL